jgi:hypothetical protein
VGASTATGLRLTFLGVSSTGFFVGASFLGFFLIGELFANTTGSEARIFSAVLARARASRGLLPVFVDGPRRER